jgi:hypothetical protein
MLAPRKLAHYRFAFSFSFALPLIRAEIVSVRANQRERE